MERTSNFTLLFCDDWFIYLLGADECVYSVYVELLPEWTDLPEGADKEDGAIEKFIVPAVLANPFSFTMERLSSRWAACTMQCYRDRIEGDAMRPHPKLCVCNEELGSDLFK